MSSAFRYAPIFGIVLQDVEKERTSTQALPHRLIND